MKKLFTLVAVALLGFSTTFAQTTTTVKQTPKKTTITTKTKTPVVKLKADGTPDLRYKENKVKKTVVVGPKKKDGTADMRYKVNKKATAKKKS